MGKDGLIPMILMAVYAISGLFLKHRHADMTRKHINSTHILDCSLLETCIFLEDKEVYYTRSLFVRAYTVMNGTLGNRTLLCDLNIEDRPI